MTEITDVRDDDLVKDVLEAFGEDIQITIAIEELSELIHALCKYRRFPGSLTARSVANEVADVELMLEQLCCIFGSDPGYVLTLQHARGEIRARLGVIVDKELRRKRGEDL